jgi:carbon storage regulator CsrA
MSAGHRPPANRKGNLVISRKQGQSVVIGDDIEVMVLAAWGKTARIGVRAPPDVKILRGESYRKALFRGTDG